MSSNLKVTLIQTSLFWQSRHDNLFMLTDKIKSIGESTDLIVLPEMFNSGFTMNPALVAESINDSPTLQWMTTQSKETGAVIMGSFVIEENKKYYNRLIWMNPDGTYQYYNKRHLFRMAGEDEQYSAGDFRLVTKLKGWKICPLICYDLRFPVWSRNRNLEYDLLIYVANWPDRRSSAWDNLLQARAIENQSYCVGVNRVGTDGNDIYYSGHSVIVDYLGEQVYFKTNDPDIITYELDQERLINYREKFPAYLDADEFKIEAP